MTTPVYAALASIPSRKRTLKKVVDSLIDQVDMVYIYLNGYERVPSWIKKSDKITHVKSSEHGDRGDAGKFFWCEEVDGVFFTCDDDIIYPENYVSNALRELSRIKNRAVLSHHGCTLARGASHYHRDKKLYPLRSKQNKARPVHVGGTGCMVFHTDLMRPLRDWFKLTNMADIWIGLKCQELRIPIIMIPHDGAEFKILTPPFTIYDATAHGDGTELDRSAESDKIVKSITWRLYPIVGR